MNYTLTLMIVEFWHGVSLSFFVVTLVRSLHKVESQADGAAKTVPLYARIAMFAFVVAGVFGYSGFVGNLVEQKEIGALLFVIGAAAGVWASFQLVPRIPNR